MSYSPIPHAIPRNIQLENSESALCIRDSKNKLTAKQIFDAVSIGFPPHLSTNLPAKGLVSAAVIRDREKAAYTVETGMLNSFAIGRAKIAGR